MPKQSDIALLLAEADKLAREIFARESAGERGLAVETVRAIVGRLSNDDAASLIGQQPKPKPASTPSAGVDISSLIG